MPAYGRWDLTRRLKGQVRNKERIKYLRTNKNNNKRAAGRFQFLATVLYQDEQTVYRNGCRSLWLALWRGAGSGRTVLSLLTVLFCSRVKNVGHLLHGWSTSFRTHNWFTVICPVGARPAQNLFPYLQFSSRKLTGRFLGRRHSKTLRTEIQYQ